MNKRRTLRVSFLCLVLCAGGARGQDAAASDDRRAAELDALKKEHLDLAASYSKMLEDLENTRTELREARKALDQAEKMREREARERGRVLEQAPDSPELVALRDEVRELRARLATAESAGESNGQNEILVSEQAAQISDLRRRLESTDADKLKWARDRAAMERRISELHTIEQAAIRQREEETLARKRERDQRELAHARALNDLRAEIAAERARHEEVVAERDAAQAKLDAMEDELERARTDARTAAGTEADAKLDLERALKQLSDAQSALASTSLELDAVKARNEEAVRDRDQAMERAEKIEAQREPDAREIQTLGEKVAALNRDVDSARREAGLQQAAAEEAEARIASLGGERKEIEARMAGLTDSLGQADAEVARQRTRAETAERDLAAAQERANQAEERARLAEEARAAMIEQASQGERALTEREADRTALAEASARIEAIEAERKSLQEADAANRAALEARGQEVAQLTASLDEARQKCAAAEAGRDQAALSGETLGRELEQARADLVEARALADRAKAAQRQVETLTEQVRALQARGVPAPEGQPEPLFQP